jgi:hypothetical protein
MGMILNTGSYLKTKEGKLVRRGDLILAQMPIDLYQAMKEHKDEARKQQTQLL